jgi:predicted hotdog family 3-hydroxylacyl-ACP dehydratase
MRWIDALTDCTDTTARATVRFDAGHFAVDRGGVLETALVECVAQTVAAALGWRAAAIGTPGAAPIGMLAAVSNFRVHARPPLGETLTIEIRELKRLGPMLLVAGTVDWNGREVASGSWSFYV